MYKYAVWHLTCRLQWAIFFFSIKLKKCQGRQGEGMGAGSDAAVCTLWAHFSSAGIHQTDAFGCQQLNKPRFEGTVLCMGWAQQSLPMSLSVWLHGLSYRAPCWAGHLTHDGSGQFTVGGMARRKWHHCRLYWSESGLSQHVAVGQSSEI